MRAAERLLGLFVAPAGAEAGTSRAFAPPVAPVRPALAALSSVGVLVPVAELDAVAVATGVLLAGRAGHPCALICRRGEPKDGPGTGTPAARRLATLVSAAGVPVRVAGRVAIADLWSDSAEDAARAAAAAELAAGAPVVTALAAREPAFDDLMAAQGRLVVGVPAEAPEALARLAVQDAARIARATGELTLPRLGPAARALAAAGLVVPGPLRSAIEAALGEPA